MNALTKQKETKHKNGNAIGYFVDIDDDEFTKKYGSDDSDNKYKSVIPKMTDKEYIELKDIFTRHEPVDPKRLYGQTDLNVYNEIERKKWPKLPKLPVLIKGATENKNNDIQRYKEYADKLLTEYVNNLIEKGIMQPPSILDDIDIIDMSKVFPPSEEIMYSMRKKLLFSDEELKDLKEYGWKIFIPYFKEMIIKTNRNRYLYIKTKNINHRKGIIDIFLQCYMGTKQQWILEYQYDLCLTFKNKNSNECEIAATNTMPYEQILSEHISEMKWTAPQKRLWADFFDIPLNWNEISIINLKPIDDIDNNEKNINKEFDNADKNQILIYNKNEQKLVMKILKNIAETDTDEDAIKKYMKNGVQTSRVPEFIQTMCIIFTYLKNFDKPDSTEEKNDRIYQKFDKLFVTSKQPMQLKK